MPSVVILNTTSSFAIILVLASKGSCIQGSCIQVIIRHEVGVPGLRKVLILLSFLLPASLTWLSCGGSSSAPSTTKTSGVAYRAFITNSVSSGSQTAGVYIVNAQTDVRPATAPISAGNTPGMMVLTPNRAQTLVFSSNGTASSDNQFTIINNAGESASFHFNLPGMTQSFVVSPDSSTAYIAVPTATVTGQSQGAIEVVSLGTGGVTAEISCPKVNSANVACSWPAPVPQGFNAPYSVLSMGNTGNRILAFSVASASESVANTVAVVTPSNAGTANPVITFVTGAGPTSFDRPIWAFFNSDDTTAYVLNCGAECGGTQASIQPLDLTTTPPTPGTPVPVPAATVALVENSTVYLAGTPLPASPCTGETTQATTCGLLTIFDLNTMSVVQPPIIITDGYHTQLSMGPNGQLYIGARTCTEVVPPVPPPTGAEVRGCLSIYNSLSTAVGSAPPGGVLIPPANGDVTGIQPIASRTVVYVIQGGSLSIYDDTIDALEYNPNDPNNPGQISNLVGDFVDVIAPDI